MIRRALVLDANILVRAVLGQRVRELILVHALDCPVWTEDTDFFGAGVATWTTDRVALYLA
jgi:hypothetical protein